MYLSVCLVLLAIFSSVSSSSSNWTISLMDRTDRKSTRLNSSHSQISYAVFCLKKTAQFEKEAHDKAPYLKFVPFVFTSALSGQRVTRILDLLVEVDAERHKRISTSQVNSTL